MNLRSFFSSCSPHIVKYQIALPPEVADALRFGLENIPLQPHCPFAFMELATVRLTAILCSQIPQ
jgi:hypothetical protein